MPEGHTGDHIAESGRKGNIIDSSREATPSGGGAQTVKVKGSGCAVLAVLLLGVLGGAGYGAIEVLRHLA